MRGLVRGALALTFLFSFAAAAEARGSTAPLSGTPNGLALTPPMGWNSWNKFACDVNEQTVRAAADAMAANGMRDAGYQYIVIDDCWQGARDEHGDIQPDATRFPSGMKALGDYIHSKGLKFGIYSDAGEKTCGGRPGSWGHEYQDAAQYARWGVDYLKYDWCNTGVEGGDQPAHRHQLNPVSAYLLMSQALQATGRPIVFSICEWGNSEPWLWARNIGNLWRSTGDITDAWEGHPRGWDNGVMNILDMQVDLEAYSGPGHWNDPDMLEIGNGGMSDTEYRAHFSLWALLAAPLIAGNDLANMTPEIRTILLNRDVIAIDQDPLGVQGRRVWKDGDYEVWARPLANGGRAVILLNRSTTPHPITVTWEQLQYPARLSMRVRDLWAHRSLGSATGRFTATAPGHGVVMIRLDP
ncbi:MAG TPA: glycoside hydrolase family 27 protein [Caulobacterales bacterium]|nr:glycoside hydrolase family 27 protein [Caulobacterales bacterium]